MKSVTVDIMSLLSGYSVSHGIFFMRTARRNFSQLLIMRIGKLPEQITEFYFLDIINFTFLS